MHYAKGILCQGKVVYNSYIFTTLYNNNTFAHSKNARSYLILTNEFFKVIFVTFFQLAEKFSDDDTEESQDELPFVDITSSKGAKGSQCYIL